MDEGQRLYLLERQTQNIVQKIRNLVQQVAPIHEEYYEDDLDENTDMEGLIEEFGNMDI